MVRLQLKRQEKKLLGSVSMSQFHYGSITTKDLFLEYNLAVSIKSQFHYGSITTGLFWSPTQLRILIVSIPLWFDYNQYKCRKTL